jgi:hypothetical protein
MILVAEFQAVKQNIMSAPILEKTAHDTHLKRG